MLELRNISYHVEENGAPPRDILRDVNLTINERFVAITGPNGGGKSTLAKVIAGIITPTSGQILLDGVKKYYDQYAFHACKVEFALASLGNDAGAYGAFKLVLDDCG